MNVAALSHALTEATNDQHLALYLASLTRSVLALHDLVANKVRFRDVEEQQLSGGGDGEKKEAVEGGGDKKKAGEAAGKGGK
jgi:26S proteasome regulatory subunit N8